jgi:hypothetical protein
MPYAIHEYRMEVSMASDFQKAFSATVIGASLFLGQTARAEVRRR